MQHLDIILKVIKLGIPRTTAVRHLKEGKCPWPRRPLDGVTSDPAYKCWENMVQRCTNPKVTGHEHYYDSGIKLHPPWKDFREFISYIGPRPSPKHSIDRIDVNGNYEPGNVRWATDSEQAQNTTAFRKLRAVYKHGKKFRVQWQGKKYTFSSYEEADEFRKKAI